MAINSITDTVHALARYNKPSYQADVETSMAFLMALNGAKTDEDKDRIMAEVTDHVNANFDSSAG